MPVPRTKPEMIRPPEIRSSIAISSATRTGLSWIGSGLPISAIVPLMRWLITAAEMLTLSCIDRHVVVVLVAHRSVEAHLGRVFVLAQEHLPEVASLLRVEDAVGKQQRRIAVLLESF